MLTFLVSPLAGLAEVTNAPKYIRSILPVERNETGEDISIETLVYLSYIPYYLDPDEAKSNEREFESIYFFINL